MNHICKFGLLETDTFIPLEIKGASSQNLLGIPNFSSIVGSQHDYYFKPTTEKQIIV